VLELAAAISGTLYLKTIVKLEYKPFVVYLWLTFFVEILALYTHVMQNNYDYTWFIYIKNSLFCRNIWLYNIYGYLAMGLIGLCYYNGLYNKIFKKVIGLSIIVYSVFFALYFTTTKSFFTLAMPYDLIIRTFIIMTYAFFFFYELLQSQDLIRFYKIPLFYITIGLLFWHVSAVPLFTFGDYFATTNANHLKLGELLILSINVVTYSCFIFGFLFGRNTFNSKDKALKSHV
jgi:hypothetical protein